MNFWPNRPRLPELEKQQEPKEQPSQAKLEYSEAAEQLKKQLYELNNENYIDTKNNILSSIYLTNHDYIIKFFKFLLMAVSIRAGSIDLYVQLTKDLLQESLTFSSNMDISVVIDPLLCKKKEVKNARLDIKAICCFFYRCFKNNLFSFEEYIKDFFDKYIEVVWCKHMDVTSILFFWFEPECLSMKDWDFDFPQSVDENAGNHSGELTVDVVFEHMYCSAETNCELDGVFEYNYPINNIISILESVRNEPVRDPASLAIMKDDSNELQAVINSVEKFNFNDHFIGTPYQWLPLINKKKGYPDSLSFYKSHPDDEEKVAKCVKYKTTYVQLACLCGSINCLKFLMLNGASLNGTMKYAIAGGNIEIIRLVEKSVTSDKSWIKMALYSIKYHRNNVFEWIVEVKFNSSSTVFRDSYLSLREECVLSDNWVAYNKLIESNFIEK